MKRTQPNDKGGSVLLLVCFAVSVGVVGAIFWHIKPAPPPAAVYQSSTALIV